MAALASGADSREPLQRFRFEEPAMGTLFRAEVYARHEAEAAAAISAAWLRVHALDAAFTDYQPDSELLRLCQQPAGHPVPLSPDLLAVLSQSREIHDRSGGAFDVTLGPLKRLWRQTRRDAVLPSPAQLAAAQALTGWDKVKLTPEGTATLAVDGMRLDLGGIAKGYAADAALQVLASHGLTRCLVAASGDVVAGDPPPDQPGWMVGAATLADPEGIHGKVLLRHQALSSSGDSIQYIEIDGVRYSHILDPETGLGMKVRRLVNVVAPTSTQADAWATAISVAGPEKVRLPPEIVYRFEEADQTDDSAAVRRILHKEWPGAPE